MLRAALVKSNWKNVVTLNTEHYIFMSFSNKTGSFAEEFISDLHSGIGIDFMQMQLLTLRILLRVMLLKDLKPCTRVIDSNGNASNLKK